MADATLTPGLPGPPEISVVMACHDAASFVGEAIGSVCGQTFSAVELIVVDDGSTDGSPAIVAARAAADPRGRLIRQENRGPYPARNRGLASARGRFIAFLDADDYWEPDCLARLHAALLESGADLAYCGWQNVGDVPAGGAPYVPPAYEEGDVVARFLRGCPWPIHACLTRRGVIDAVGGFSERCFSAMDFDLWLRIAGHTQRIVRVPAVLAYYRWHGNGQISSVRWRQVVDAWRVRRDFVRFEPRAVAHLDRRQLRALVHGDLLRRAYTAYWRRDFDSATPLFRLALATGCWRLPDLKYLLPACLPARLYRALLQRHDRRTE